MLYASLPEHGKGFSQFNLGSILKKKTYHTQNLRINVSYILFTESEQSEHSQNWPEIELKIKKNLKGNIIKHSIIINDNQHMLSKVLIMHSTVLISLCAGLQVSIMKIFSCTIILELNLAERFFSKLMLHVFN